MRNLLIVFLITSIVACETKKTDAVNADVYYTCSMDPQVVEYKPGKCPICKMDLTPVTKKKGEKMDELQLSEQQIQLGNIQTDTILKGTIRDQQVLSATVNFNQQTTQSISARVMGRVDHLYFKNIGDYVQKGQPLYSIYSEELNNAKQELLLALDRKKTLGNGTLIDMDRLIASAKNKLLLWGLSENQISELSNSKKINPITTYYAPSSGYITNLNIKEGDYVMEGGSVVTLADLSTVWIEAQVYTTQLAELNAKGNVKIILPDYPGKTFWGTVLMQNPEVSRDTRINLLRVQVANQEQLFKPGMSAYVAIESPPHKNLSLPIDAVIRDSKSAMVWIKVGENTFKNVMVTTGLESGNRVEILSGLKEGDIVVTSGAYLLHSEYIFKKGANPMSEHQHH